MYNSLENALIGCTVYRPQYTVYGLWFMVYGLRFTVYGLPFTVYCLLPTNIKNKKNMPSQMTTCFFIYGVRLVHSM